MKRGCFAVGCDLQPGSQVVPLSLQGSTQITALDHIGQRHGDPRLHGVTGRREKRWAESRQAA